jgi:uncharacterized membrane protein (DUF485 family)
VTDTMGHPPTTRGSTVEQVVTPFGGSLEPPHVAVGATPDFAAIQASDDFVRLRARLLRFIFPMTAAFLGWYLLYVLLAAYARSFMSFHVLGDINVGLVLGFLQFVSTAVITLRYVRFSRKNIDPDVEAIRTQAGVTG